MFLTRFAAPGTLTAMSNEALAAWSSRLSNLFDGIFKVGNEFNSSIKGTIVHLKQIENTLRAAVVLAA